MGGLTIGSIALYRQGNGAYGKSAHNFKSIHTQGQLYHLKYAQAQHRAIILAIRVGMALC